MNLETDAMVSKRMGGFTIVELLVVVSIVSVLLALVMPSMMQVRENGKRLTCLANERAVGQGALMYATDNRNFGPPTTYNNAYQWHRPTTSTVTDVDGNTYPTYAGMDAYFGYNESMPATGKFYYRAKGCPAFSASYVGNGAGAAFAGNHNILGLANTTVGVEPIRDYWMRFDDRRIQPSVVTLFIESYHGQVKDLSLVAGGRPNSPYVWAARHEDGLNVVMVDGHGLFAPMENGSFTVTFQNFVPGSKR